MIKKSFVQYFFFNFALACIALSDIAHAAQIIVSDKELIQRYSSFNALLDNSPKNNIDKDSASEPSKQTPNIKKTESDLESKENIPDDSVEKLPDSMIAGSKQNSLPINNIIQAEDLLASDPYEIIKQAAKKLLKENSENELLQDSLIAISHAKLKFDKAEQIINELAGELLSSMEPNQLMFSDMVTLQQKTTSDSILVRNDESVLQIFQSQEGLKELSGSRKHTRKNYDYNESESVGIIILRKIFHVNTLLYLLGIILISPVFMRLFRFLVYGKYQDSFGD